MRDRSPPACMDRCHLITSDDSAAKRRFILRNRPMVAGYILLSAALFLITVQAYHANAFPGDLFLTRGLQSVRLSPFDLVMQTVTQMGFPIPSALIGCLVAAAVWAAR